MKITRKSRRQLHIQNLIFLVGLLAVMGIIAWLSTQYSYQTDWSASQSNSLSNDSITLLQKIPEAVHITAFSREDPILRKRIRDLIGRYQRIKNDIHFKFVNPDAEPDRVRELGITRDGEILIAYQGRSEKVSQLTEQNVTNALLRIARQKEGKIFFISGHGERDPHGEANHALGNFGKIIEQKGIELDTLNLAETPSIPESTRLLVIASPQVSLLPGEVKLIVDYVKQGGNLLWLAEPKDNSGLAPLAELLGVEFLPGVIVDASTQLFGINNPAFALVPAYRPHPVTQNMDSLTLFPQAVALQIETENGWDSTAVLTTVERSWTELGKLDGTISLDPDSDERGGPLDIGFALTRSPEESDDDASENETGQRVVIIGDGDFLANSYLGNGGNLDLGLNLIDWLNHDDQFISITVRSAGDTTLELSKTAQILIGFGFLFVLPAVLLFSGLFIWWRRRTR
ncbi:MAG: GldG family protein [Gammaproteobacteria bacterium]